MIVGSKVPAGKNKNLCNNGLKDCRASHFSLLMQNLGVLEEIFADSDVLRMEREILLHLGRLGALKLFNTCLSRTFETANFMDLSDIPTESMDDHAGKNIIRSRKGKVRKSRARMSEILNKGSSWSFPSETISQVLQQPTVSSVKRSSNSRSRRLAIAKNEAEMSIGVKVVFIY